MRVIAGKFRGRKLKSPPSLETRPTSDRLRETLFNIIAPRIVGARFLDLCAGTGAVGIEALSRGAAHATLVDNSRKMGQLIEANLELCCVEQDQGKVIVSDAAEFLRRHGHRAEPWDMIFFDPPYDGDYPPVVQLLGRNTNELLAADGLLIIEHHHKNELPEVNGGLRRYRVLQQGESALSFYQRAESD